MSNDREPAPAFIRDLQDAVKGEVWADAVQRGLYSTDASIYQVTPLCVVVPQHPDDLRAALDIAAAHAIPVLPRGAGTSLAGQAVNQAMVLDCTRHLDHVLEIDPEGRLARVQPGVIRDDLNALLRPHGLHFAPDPATGNRATFGGMIGNNSAGARSVQYGMVRDHVDSLRVRLANGTEFTTRPREPAEFRHADDPEAMLLRGLYDLTLPQADLIRSRYPRVMRRCTGYALDAFVGPGPWDLAQLFTGSEGTLGTTLEATVRLEPLPAYRGLCLLHYQDLLAAAGDVHPLLACQPTAIEVLDRTVIQQALHHPSLAPLCDFIEGEPEAVLIVECSGDTREAVREGLAAAEAIARERHTSYATVRRDDPDGMGRVWQVRKNGLGLVLGVKGARKPLAFIEDTAVPTEHLARYLGEVRDLCARHDTTCTVYGHASVGLLHIRPFLDLRRTDDVERFRRITDGVFELVRELGGSWSGEHGNGRIRSPYLERYFGPELTRTFAEVKRLFDPEGRMNPGIIVDPEPIDRHLRLGPDFVPPRQPVAFRYPEGDLAGALVQCSGVGACLTRETGTMCPSYRVTRDEADGVRGRANALRLAMTGQLEDEDAAADALDACLSCKACKNECPSNVDVARLKAEWQHRRHQRHGVPLTDRLIGATPALARRLAGPAAPLANAVQRAFLPRLVLQRVAGIDRRRPLPDFTRHPFQRTEAGPPDGPEVCLFADTYTSFHEPGIAQAAMDLLADTGYRVRVLRPGCCQRPHLSRGRLEVARVKGEPVLQALDDEIQQGRTVVTLEPGCWSALIDDLPNLLRDEALTARLRQNILPLETFLVRELDADRAPGTFTSRHELVLIHRHCHEKALAPAHDLARLYRKAGAKAEVVDAGCCGMAGSFGYEKKHHALSLRIAEDRLLPALRAAENGTVVVASGFSCRHQIRDLTEREAVHWVETLRVSR